MSDFVSHAIHFLILILVITFLIFVGFLITNRIAYQISTYRKKIEKAKTGSFLTSLIFSEFDEQIFSQQIEEFKKTVPFDKKWYKELMLNSIISLKQNLKGDITQNIHFIYEKFGLFDVSLALIKSKFWYIKSIGIYHFQVLEYAKGEPYVRPYLNSENEILASNAYIALVSLTSNKLDFLIDYSHAISLPSEIKIMNILHSKKPPVPQNLNDWIQSGNPSIIRLGLKFMVYYNHIAAGNEILLLLQSNNADIRYEVITTARELFIEGAEEALIWQFDKEEKHSKIAILNSLGMIGTEISEKFLSRLLMILNDTDIKLAAVKSLNEINPDFFESNFQDDDLIQRMLKHVKDPYL